MGTINKQVVLITGGLTGIGRAAAVAFAKKGAEVVVAGRRDEAGKALVEELRARSPTRPRCGPDGPPPHPRVAETLAITEGMMTTTQQRDLHGLKALVTGA